MVRITQRTSVVAAVLILAWIAVAPVRGSAATPPAPPPAADPADAAAATRPVGEWCDTERVWAEKARALYGARAGCPNEGQCDDPPVRDAYIPDGSTPFTTIRLHFLIFRENDGSDPAATREDMDAQVMQMNADYAPYRYRFVYTCQFIDNSVYRDLTDAEVDPMKDAYAVTPTSQCNVFVTDLFGGVLGVGTFPWDPDALGNRGGIIVDEGAFGAAQRTMTHEMAHNLGLWHTHRGVSEFTDDQGNPLPCVQGGSACGCPCYERADGTDADTTGDFSSETPPTPVNFTCAAPPGTDACSGTSWGPTQPQNYMSYAPDSCYTLFMDEQAGRMHCWTQERLIGWLRIIPASQQAQLLASDGATYDRFGRSVALCCDTALVGAYTDDDLGADSGSAYVFERTGGVWSQTAKLLASDGAAENFFGWSVALSGDTALVGADWAPHGYPAGAGSAYVFVRTGGVWTQQARLLASDGAAGDEFGESVALSGDTALVGAPADDDFGNWSGSAYIFERRGGVWTQAAKLLPSDGAADDWFGLSVAISGDTALVGAWLHDDLGINSGAAYIFQRTSGVWAQAAKLLASDGALGGVFGWPVALSGDTAMVGAVWDDDFGARSGSAYVFQRTGGVWTQAAKLLASDGAFGDEFGVVSLSGDTALVGAYRDDDLGMNSGSAYLFQRIGGVWTQAAKLLPSEYAAGDRFGLSVALSGDMALVGAEGNNDFGTDSGSAHIFNLSLTLGDLDGDGDVDLTDFVWFISCVTGPGGGELTPACVPPDADGDGDVDLDDFAAFQNAFTGP